jgi:hypothetical protein
MDPKATPSPTPPSGGLQWTLIKDGRRLTCEFRSHGKFGWECQFLEDGEFVAGRRFAMRAQAAEWAESERAEHEHEGWTPLR